MNIDEPGQTGGMPFLVGYDFFVAHAGGLSQAPDAGMLFGGPSWITTSL
jgi:hypothetical protein